MPLDCTRRDLLKTAAVGAGVLLTGELTMGEPLDRTAWEKEREAQLAKLKAWRGDLPPRGDLNPRELYRREWATHTEIKLTYEGEPNERIPAYLLLPRKPLATPTPAIFAAHQCGLHCDTGKEQVVGKRVDLPDQAYGYELVCEGFAVLAPDANKVGERYDPKLRQPWEIDKPRCCTAPGGSWGSRWKRVYDVMRGFDLLSSYAGIDKNRLGMIGHSLGADTTIWTMPWEDRIRAAAISGGGLMMSWPYGLPYADVLRLIAPRPFFEVTGAWDGGANWPGQDRVKPKTVDDALAEKRQALARAREVYALYGKSDCLGCFEHPGEHCFPTEGRQAAYAWLKKHLS